MSYDLLDLRTRVRKKIKDTSYDAPTVDGFINDSIVEVADLYRWREFEKITEGSLTVDEYTFEQQTDHQKTRQLIIIDPVTSTSHWDITSYRMTPDDFFSRFPAPDTQTSSQPVHWTEYGDQIYFNAPVDKAYKLRQLYYKIPTELTADADVPELPRNFREIIVLGAAYRCEEERGNYDIAGVLQNRFNDRLSDLIMLFANKTSAGPDTVVLPGIRGRG